ncbi:MAG TPA: Spy/CpxP family protein refolding chaperone [Bacteroidota bacterium]|nr:Spy/CpxP family protein refolding chaperone [Bacteroidota bacterium]
MRPFPLVLAAALAAGAPSFRCALSQDIHAARPGPETPGLLPPGEHGGGIPDLSDQQKAEMRKIRIALAEKSLPLRNQLGEKEAHLRTLMTAREVDLVAVEQTAQEIGDLRTQIFRAEIQSRVKTRGLLTDEQKGSLDALPFPGTPMAPPGPGAPPPLR